MKKHINWLLHELDRWVQEGIIDNRQAGAIRRRYPAPEEAGSWGRTAFAVAGAVLIGLGVILLFAYNWERMHKFAKLAAVFSALIMAHGSALAVDRPAAKETLHALGTMFFGAGIWLVAQVYHINEHYPNAFLVWGVGALSLAWVLPSLAQGLMATVLFALWNGFEVFAFRSPNYAAPALVLLGVLPLAWLLRSRVLSSAGLLAFLFMLFSELQRVSWKLMIPVFLSCAAIFVAAALLLQRNKRAPELAPVLFFFGNTLYFFLLYILTFPGTRDVLTFLTHYSLSSLWIVIPAAAALGLWIAALLPFGGLKERLASHSLLAHLAVPAAFVIYLLLSLPRPDLYRLAGRIPYNLLFLFSSIMLMQRGFRNLHLRSAVIGSVLLAALAVARYADLFQSLLARAVVFLLVGGMMIGVAVFFARARSGRREGTP